MTAQNMCFLCIPGRDAQGRTKQAEHETHGWESDRLAFAR